MIINIGILWCFVKDIKTLFFICLEICLEWYTSALGTKCLKGWKSKLDAVYAKRNDGILQIRREML